MMKIVCMRIDFSFNNRIFFVACIKVHKAAIKNSYLKFSNYDKYCNDRLDTDDCFLYISHVALYVRI